jgi:cytidylate kinase
MPLAESHAFDTDRMIALMEEIMGAIAQEGNAVVVGRGAPYFLRGRDDTFSVFTYAPQDEKIRRLLKMGKSRQEAEELLMTVDKERIAFVKHYFNADWPTRSLYHMMLNTKMGDERVIGAILDTMHALQSSSAEQPVTAVR